MVRPNARITKLIADAENYALGDETAISMTSNGALP